MDKLMNAWALLLDGFLTYNSVNVPVYKEDIPEDFDSHYVLLRAESEFDAGNKRSFATESVVVVDIVTLFQNNVNRSVADNIDGQIAALILPTVAVNALSAQSGMQILNVKMETCTWIREYQDGSQTSIYRKVSRYNHLIYQTA